MLGAHAEYYENLMYRLVLNGESHYEGRIKSLEDWDFLGIVSPEEKHKIAKDVLCMMYELNPNHVKAHLAEQPDAETTIGKWIEAIPDSI